MLELTIYTTGPECMQCAMTKRALDKQGISYQEIDLRTEPSAHRYVTEQLGYIQAPVVIAEENGTQNTWAGFRPDRIKRLGRTE